MCIGGPNDTRKMSRGFLSHVYAWPLNARRIDPDGGATVVHCMAMLQLRHGWMLFTPPYTPATSAPGLAQPGHICTRCTRTGPPRPHLHRDWERPDARTASSAHCTSTCGCRARCTCNPHPGRCDYGVPHGYPTRRTRPLVRDTCRRMRATASRLERKQPP
jgi:hypothetical protein